MSLRSTSAVLSALAIFALVAFSGCGGGGAGDGGVNVAPVINSLVAVAQAIWQGQQTNITANATDGNGDALSYAWATTGGTITGTGKTVTFAAPQTGGAYTVTVTVTDGRGGQDVEQIVITVGAIVQGTTVDVNGGTPEGGVPVTVDGISTTSGATGAFSIVGIRQGQHTLQIGGDYGLVGADVVVTANTAGQTVQVGNVTVVDVGVGPPPPPF